jgi:hypothetical protein
MRPIHDAVVEDVFDHVEHTLTGTVNRTTKQPNRLTSSVARRMLTRWVEPCTDGPSELLGSTLPRIDAQDCWTTPLLPGDPTDPERWAQLILGRPSMLLRLRDVAVKPLGLRSASQTRVATGFPVVCRDADEIVLGLDDRHLDFRVGVAVRIRRVEVTTIVHVKNRLGSVYWGVVRHLHPIVVRRLMRRTAPTAAPADHP